MVKELTYEYKENHFYLSNRGAIDMCVKIDTAIAYPFVGVKTIYKIVEVTDSSTYETMSAKSKLSYNNIPVEIEYIPKDHNVVVNYDNYSFVLPFSPSRFEVDNLFTAITNKIIERSSLIEKGRKMQDLNGLERVFKANKGTEMAIMNTADMRTETMYTNEPLQDRFSKVVGNISEVTKGINTSTSLGDNEEIAEAFVKAKEYIASLSNKKPNTATGFADKLLKGNRWYEKAKGALSRTVAENKSIQQNIDFLFGLIHEKYEKLVETGEGLQKAKIQLTNSLLELRALQEESEEKLAVYANKSDIPIRELSLNTQIGSAAEKYNDRLLKIDSAIIAMQGTIMALAKDLPARKTDLMDEMAISSLLNSVDDYQNMYKEVGELVSTVTDQTAEQTYSCIKNLFELQINDNHTINYLAASKKRTEKFANMVADSSERLAIKVRKDADEIQKLAHNPAIANAKSKINQISM